LKELAATLDLHSDKELLAHFGHIVQLLGHFFISLSEYISQ